MGAEQLLGEAGGHRAEHGRVPGVDLPAEWAGVAVVGSGWSVVADTNSSSRWPSHVAVDKHAPTARIDAVGERALSGCSCRGGVCAAPVHEEGRVARLQALVREEATGGE